MYNLFNGNQMYTMYLTFSIVFKYNFLKLTTDERGSLHGFAFLYNYIHRTSIELLL
jgi:hypothetical protein